MLPKPDCEAGYTVEQVDAILAEHGCSRDAFNHWMRGQTVTLCEGRAYNHSTRKYEPACNGVAHGMVTYGVDVRCFLRGRAPLD